MNKKELLQRIFPQASATVHGRDASEVNGLPKDTVPQNCDILVRAMNRWDAQRKQEHYLVRIDGVMLYLRVCTAMAGSGYDEYAAILRVCGPEDNQAEFESRVRSSIESICRER